MKHVGLQIVPDWQSYFHHPDGTALGPSNGRALFHVLTCAYPFRLDQFSSERWRADCEPYPDAQRSCISLSC